MKPYSPPAQSTTALPPTPPPPKGIGRFSRKNNIKPAGPEFIFLEICSVANPVFDLTSAGSLHPTYSGIGIPEKVSSLMRNINFDNFVEVRGQSNGEPEVLTESINFFNRQGIVCSAEKVSLTDNILLSLERMYDLLQLNAEKKILVLTPTFGYYFKQLADKNIPFETLETERENGFLPTRENLERKLNETGAVALLMCYPNNPTGAIMTRECAEMIADVAAQKDIFVLSDEAFMNNRLGESMHFPIAAIPAMIERSFTVTSSAKSFPTGIKTGFCVGPADFMESFAKLGGYPTKQSQKVLAATLENSDENRDYLERCRQYYLQNIAAIKEKLTELNTALTNQFSATAEYVKPFISDPAATNVYLLDFSGLRGKMYNEKPMNTGLDVAEWLLDTARVATVPGECSFFNKETMLVRIALNDATERFREAFDSIISAVPTIQNSQVAIDTESAIPAEIPATHLMPTEVAQPLVTTLDPRQLG